MRLTHVCATREHDLCVVSPPSLRAPHRPATPGVRSRLRPAPGTAGVQSVDQGRGSTSRLGEPPPAPHSSDPPPEVSAQPSPDPDSPSFSRSSLCAIYTASVKHTADVDAHPCGSQPSTPTPCRHAHPQRAAQQGPRGQSCIEERGTPFIHTRRVMCQQATCACSAPAAALKCSCSPAAHLPAPRDPVVPAPQTLQRLQLSLQISPAQPELPAPALRPPHPPCRPSSGAAAFWGSAGPGPPSLSVPSPSPAPACRHLILLCLLPCRAPDTTCLWRLPLPFRTCNPWNRGRPAPIQHRACHTALCNAGSLSG